jgi:hypothetical protein
MSQSIKIQINKKEWHQATKPLINNTKSETVDLIRSSNSYNRCFAGGGGWGVDKTIL